MIMDYGKFIGTTSGVSGLRALLSHYEGANLRFASNDYGDSCMVEIWYDSSTNTITLA